MTTDVMTLFTRINNEHMKTAHYEPLQVIKQSLKRDCYIKEPPFHGGLSHKEQAMLMHKERSHIRRKVFVNIHQSLKNIITMPIQDLLREMNHLIDGMETYLSEDDQEEEEEEDDDDDDEDDSNDDTHDR